MKRARRRAFDPIDLEILWNRLVLVVDEAAYAIVRTSMSKVVVKDGISVRCSSIRRGGCSLPT